MRLVHYLVGPGRQYASYSARAALTTLERLGFLDLDRVLSELEAEAVTVPAEIEVAVEPGDILGLMMPAGERGGRVW